MVTSLAIRYVKRIYRKRTNIDTKSVVYFLIIKMTMNMDIIIG